MQTDDSRSTTGWSPRPGFQVEIVGDIRALPFRDLGAERKAGHGVVAVFVDVEPEDPKAMPVTEAFQPLPGFGVLTGGQAGNQ